MLAQEEVGTLPIVVAVDTQSDQVGGGLILPVL